MSAKNYTVSEAITVLRGGKDLEAIRDICRRYPLFAYHSMTEEGLVKMLSEADSLRPRMLEKGLKNVNTVVEDYEDVVVEKVEKAKPKAKSKPKAEPIDEDEDDEVEAIDYSKLKGKELQAICKEKGFKITKGMTKQNVVDMLTKAQLESVDDEDEDDDDDWGM